MGLRFFRRFELFPGVRLNVSRSGLSVSLGPRGAHVTLGPGGTRMNVGLPGTGLSYSTRLDSKPAKRGGEPARAGALATACDALLAGDEDGALDQLRALRADPDAAFVAGVLLLRAEGDPFEAESLLRQARSSRVLGKRLAAVGAHVRLELRIDDDSTVSIEADRIGATLALAETLQRQGRIAEAVELVRGELQRAPDDVRLRMSLEDLELTG